MKKSELKQIIKPLVKECIYETLVEGGLLSGIITEVVRGINSGNRALVTEQVDREEEARAAAQKEASLEAQRQKQKLNETKRKMLEAIGQDSYNGVDLFEGTDPISKPGYEGSGAAAPQSPLSHVKPGDAGVDLGNFSGISKKWGSLAK